MSRRVRRPWDLYIWTGCVVILVAVLTVGAIATAVAR